MTTHSNPSPTIIAPRSAEGAALVSLMGNKKVAGRAYPDIQFGMPMIRLDIPATTNEVAFTRFYHLQAIFHVQPCSEAQMQAAAEYLREPMFPPFLESAENAR